VREAVLLVGEISGNRLADDACREYGKDRNQKAVVAYKLH
jgi:hypothetical protein